MSELCDMALIKISVPKGSAVNVRSVPPLLKLLYTGKLLEIKRILLVKILTLAMHTAGTIA